MGWKKWEIKTEWIPRWSISLPLIEKDAAQYAKEKGCRRPSAADPIQRWRRPKSALPISLIHLKRVTP